MVLSEAELKMLTPRLQKSLRAYVEDHAGDHDEDCPCDDTCECSYAARNSDVSRLCDLIDPLIEMAQGVPKARVDACMQFAAQLMHKHPGSVVSGTFRNADGIPLEAEMVVFHGPPGEEVLGVLDCSLGGGKSVVTTKEEIIREYMSHYDPDET